MVEHRRTLDFKVAFAIGLGTMIAAGIFSLSGQAVAAVGSSAVLAFVLAAAVASITAMTYSEFASIYAENGGGYLFSSRTFQDSDLLTYGIGASLFLGYTGTTAFYLATMDEWFFTFIVPGSLAWLPHGSIGIVAALLLGLLNARGTEESGTFQLLVTSAKVLVLLVFIAGALAFASPRGATGEFVASFQTEPIGIVSVAAMAFITFFGFSAIAASAGEIIEPRKTVPKAIAASIVTVTVLYTLVIVAMVNVPPEHRALLEAGETAMGEVAQVFIGPLGQWLIVAGAVFSMISASNASILAASGIGSLMGERGQAPRPFARIHPDYGTPSWSVGTATATIVGLIALFIGLLPHEVTMPALGAVDLGLRGLTGFATFNLLVPLAAVNYALVRSRSVHPDIDRPLRVPLVPLLPALGIVANLALVGNLPPAGVLAGVLGTLGLFLAYRFWGGQPEVEELFEAVEEPEAGGSTGTGGEAGSRVLVPVGRPDRAPRYVRLASMLAETRSEETAIEVLTVTEIPEQTPFEIVEETAAGRAARVREELEAAGVGTDVRVSAHVCRDVAFDIVQTARDTGADLVVMGYPEERRDLTEAVAYDAPCDVVFSQGFSETDDLDLLNVGAGAGPHHRAALPLVDALGEAGSEIHLVSVEETVAGTPEEISETLDALSGTVTTTVHRISSATVAEGLVDTAAENGGVLLIGASRDRRLRQWLFGSTPDRVVDRAVERGVPVLVYSSTVGVRGWFEDWLFPVYRYAWKLLGRGEASQTPADAGG